MIRLGQCLLLCVLVFSLLGGVGGGSRAAEKSETPSPRVPTGDERKSAAEAHYELGVFYHEKVFESLDKAIAEYEKAVKLQPDLADVHFHLGLSYHTKAKLGGEEKELYRKALAEYRLYLKYRPAGELAAKAKQNIRAVEPRVK